MSAGDRPGGDRDDGRDELGAAGGDRPTHPAVFASNWRTVLLVDALMGAAIVVAGAVVAVVWNLAAGAVLGVLGAAYVTAVVRRGRSWAEQRRAAGL